MAYTLGEIARHINAELTGNAGCEINSVASLQSAKTGQISFFADHRYRYRLKKTRASAVIIARDNIDICPVCSLVVDNPYLSYIKLLELFYPPANISPGIHSSAMVSPSAKIDSTVVIGPHVYIADNVVIGPNSLIEAGCVIQADVSIGADTHLYPNVTLYQAVSIGERVILHSGVIIGADGFGLVNAHGHWHKIPQIGSVVIGDDVEIGANSCVDRGAIDNTVIEQGVKIDNQVQIGHNTHVGAHTAIAACAGIAGSVKIGRCCMIGGATGINGHLEIADQVIIGGYSAVAKSIKSPGTYSSVIPVEESSLWRRLVARIKKLDDLAKKITRIEKQMIKH